VIEHYTEKPKVYLFNYQTCKTVSPKSYSQSDLLYRFASNIKVDDKNGLQIIKRNHRELIMPHYSNYQYPDANFKTLYLSLNFPSSSMVMWSDSGHPR